jgi:hypothetical protein
MLVEAAPQEVPLKKILAGAVGATKEWHVRLIDSSMSAHGSHDTRYEKGEKHSGVGQRTIRIYTDAADEVVGYTWSIESTKTVYAQKTHHLVNGGLARD